MHFIVSYALLLNKFGSNYLIKIYKLNVSYDTKVYTKFIHDAIVYNIKKLILLSIIFVFNILCSYLKNNC